MKFVFSTFFFVPPKNAIINAMGRRCCVELDGRMSETLPYFFMNFYPCYLLFVGE
jgi:hypothetical protein